MATNESYVMTSHNLLNYSGLLFNKGNTLTPFSTLIGGKQATVNHWEFPMALTFTTGGGQSQPAITETASLTAPNPSFVTRTQVTNYCQIFQKTLSISYGKKSSMGQLAGVNVAGQVANPANELDFQVANAMQELANDIEYTFINGSAQNGTYDDVAYKTGGIISLISTNSTSASSAGLGYWLIAGMIETIYKAYAPTDGLVLMAAPVHIMQLNADAAKNGLTIVPAGRDVNGIKIDTLITPFGTIGLLPNVYVPQGTAVFVNPSVCRPVGMPVPDKGNFFLEPLAKNGAADRYQIYGQLGLDIGSEHYHGKLTSLSTSFAAPTFQKSVWLAGGTADVKVTNTSASPVNVDAKIVNTSDNPVPTQEVTE